jgi:polar amino acid transport system substrate-binding protein
VHRAARPGDPQFPQVAQQLPTGEEVAVFNDNAAAVSALKDEQVDGLVVDLPTADYLVNVEVEGGVIVGALSALDPYGILMAKDSPLTACTTQAVDELRADGTLDALAEKWLPDTFASTPTLQ